MNQWYRDPRLEQTLLKLKIPYSYRKDIPIADMNIRGSLANNARADGAVDPELAARYAFDMGKGDCFPGIVVEETDRGYLILGGNQRMHAAKIAGRTHVDAFVIKSVPPREKEALLRLDNTYHGKLISLEEKIMSCVELITKHRMTITKACELFFASNDNMYAMIERAKLGEEVRLKLAERGVMDPLESGTRTAMHPIIKDINVLCDVAHLASEYSLTGEKVKEVVKEIGSKSSEAERHAVVIRYKADLNAIVKRGSLPLGSILRRQVFSFRKFLTTGYEGEAFPSVSKVVEDKKQAEELKQAIDAIIASLKVMKEKA